MITATIMTALGLMFVAPVALGIVAVMALLNPFI